jgi:hypothetical protein
MPPRAFPRGGNPIQNRWTRPAWLVNVPPRSTNDADGRTACAARETAPSFVPTWATKGTRERSSAVLSPGKSASSLPKTSRAFTSPPSIFRTMSSNFSSEIPRSCAPRVLGFLSALMRKSSESPFPEERGENPTFGVRRTSSASFRAR